MLPCLAPQELNYAYANMKRAMDCIEHCVVLLDTSEPGFKIVYTNQAWNDITGTPAWFFV